MNTRHVRKRNGLKRCCMVGLVGCVVLVGISSTAQAASDQSTGTTSAKVTILDPFLIKVVPVSTSSVGPRSAGSVETTSAVSSTNATFFSRPTIRIPPRLPPRSAFHPRPWY